MKRLFALVSAVALTSSPVFARDGEGLEDMRKLQRREEDKEPHPVESSSTWRMGTFGYLRGVYEYTTPDKQQRFIGRNNGFLLESARLGFEGKNAEYGFSFRLSIELASDAVTTSLDPRGELEVRGRDGFLTWEPSSYVGVRLGQFRIPFSQEDLRGTPDLLFISRAVAQEGVLSGRGYAEPGIGVDREIGAMIASPKPIALVSKMKIGYYLSVFNGNGRNQLVNDNNQPAFAGRIELAWSDIIQAGGALLYNPRTVGAQPDLYKETDQQWAADLLFTWQGLELFGQASARTTTYNTVEGTPDRLQLGYHGQVGYKIKQLPIPLMPGYRYAVYDPWASGGGQSNDPLRRSLDRQKLQYHTFGVRAFHPALPVSAYVNYTLTIEEKPRQLSNDRLEVLAQLIF
ncbi:MAG: porin [Myxococcales bacterium]|nr:OprO/OprP family phosphate-selective porin [Polyangiaceae bacterium]MDW8251291.1 porin [Myxococcales bacterium]